jgi:hypothetical protein
MSVVVIFRAFEGETVAFFPEDPDGPTPDLCASYVHVGQHGAASREFYRETAPTNDYDDLLDELERIGYVLNVQRRWTRKMDETRRAVWNEYRRGYLRPYGAA